MRAGEVTLAEVLKDQGYATGCFGKWHNGAHFPNHPTGQGFDEFVGFCAGHWNNYFGTTLEGNGVTVETSGYITDVLTDAAISFIERKAGKSPFFCYIPYNAPHSPWQVPDRYYNKYRRQGLDEKTSTAYGMVENLDDNIGRILERLDSLGLSEDTIVLFLTDNGPNSDRFNGGMKGRKGSLHEGGVRVPLFVRWPGRIRRGLEIPEISAHIDLLPTILELCEVEGPEAASFDGRSLAPLLREDETEWPDRRIFQYWRAREVVPDRGAVRTQQWRAVKYETWSLYDMNADPGQTLDLAGEFPEVLDELSQSFEGWFEEVTVGGFDPIPVPVGYPESPEVVMPGHEAFLNPEVGQGISYSGSSGWANDWVDNWTSIEAYPFWEVDVVRSGSYEVVLMYVCPAADLGSRLRVEIGNQVAEAQVEVAHDPEPIPSPDRVPRGEVYEKVWAPLKMGTLALEKGRTQLRVRALSREGGEVIDLKSVVLRRIED